MAEAEQNNGDNAGAEELWRCDYCGANRNAQSELQCGICGSRRNECKHLLLWLAPRADRSPYRVLVDGRTNL